MAAYIIADVEVLDPQGYEPYRAQVPAVIAAYGGTYRARGGALETLEGDWTPNRCVIIEFPDIARLKAFYNSPEYAPLLAIRKRCAKSRIVAVEGYLPPA
jgi:uncharacterized protein (DUF1330 family)